MNRHGKVLLFAFTGIFTLLAIFLVFIFVGNIELASLVDEDRVAFERNIAEQGASLNRVVFALSDVLMLPATDGNADGQQQLIELGQSALNHANIPLALDPVSLAEILEDDPLYLAERVAKANDVYQLRLRNMGSLLDTASSNTDSTEVASVLADFLAEARLFLEELREYSRLSVQVAGAYHASNRSKLDTIHDQIELNLIELIILTAMLAFVSVLFIRSRLNAERELELHRDRLTELVAIRTRELSLTNEHLSDALAVKEVLIKEVYHRVKNNLSMVAGLISLQQTYASADNLEQSFESLSERIRAISLIHEKLYRSSDLTSILFSEYVFDLVSSLKFSLCHDQDAVGLEFDVEPTRFSPNLLLPLGLIITELVTNSLKHAFRQTGRGVIRLALVSEDEDWVLTVRDNGTPPADKKTILESTSLGALLVMNLVLQIGGHMDLDISGGTTFTIRFPKTGPGVTPAQPA